MEEETQSPEQQPDRISELSDTLLHRILSSLDFRYVIRTNFLSRRWRYVWISLPYLNFDLEQYRDRPSHQYEDIAFEAFVNRVLFRHIQRSTNLHSFSLSFDSRYGFDLKYINTWIQVSNTYNNAVDIELNASDSIMEVHPSLFTCTSLTKLRLAAPEGGDSLDIIFDGLAVNLPKLKTLHLEGIIIYPNGSIASGSFLGGCPVLETLVILDCCLNDHGWLHIFLPQLKTLEVTNLEYCTGCNIAAPKLASFKCKSRLCCEYTFVEEATSLLKATVMFYDKTHWRHLNYIEPLDKVATPENLIGNLTGISSVKSLILSTTFFEVIKVPECLESELLQFPNLRFLRLSDILLSRSHTFVIPYLVKKCPNVETLSLKMAPTLLNQVKLKTGDKSWRPMIQCPELYNLKFLEIQNVVGCKTVLEFLEFFMKHAEKLEKVNIFTFEAEEALNQWHRSRKSIARKKNRMERFSSMLKKLRLAYSSIEISFLSGTGTEPQPEAKRVRAKASTRLQRNRNA